MSVVGLVAAAMLFGVGTWLLLHRSLVKVIVGLGVISHGANLLILSLAGPDGRAPVLTGDDLPTVSDPLAQAMVLTAIVITFGVTAFLLALSLRAFLLRGSDEVEDDAEDRRIAGEGEAA